MRPRIGLLTDFGTTDHYVAAMKGVLLGRSDADLVDLGHDVSRFDVFAAGWFLRSVIPYFPRDRSMTFVAVVDPGVGTERKIVAAEADGQRFVAPDNGLLPLAIEAEARFHIVEREDLYLSGGSTTFHGRDRFAPVGAELSQGIPLSELGPAVERDDLVRLSYGPPEYRDDGAAGTVVSIDHFGNVITDLERSKLRVAPPLVVRLGWHAITREAEHYAQPKGEPFHLVGSSGTIEISLAGASAADVLQISRFDRVEVLQAPRPGA